MNIKVSRQINYIIEEMAILERLTGESENVSEEKRKQLSQKTLARIKVSEELVGRAKEKLAPDMEKVELYFKKFPNLSFCMAQAVLLYMPEDEAVRADNLAEYVLNLSEDEKNARFLQLQSFDTEKAGKDGGQNIEYWIERLDTADDVKWRVLQAYMRREEYIKELIPLLKKAEEILTESKIGWEPILEEFERFWIKKAAEQTVIDDIRRVFGIDVTDKEKVGDIILCPWLVAYNRLSFRVREDKDEDYYFIGIIFGDDFYFDTVKEEQLKQNEIFSILKILSDKSKFQILLSVRDTKVYGAQLAKQMGLTTATISYHMNGLVERGLVSVERIDNRIYFSLNKEKIKALTDSLNVLFLNE